jgi:hypothetical protein
MVEGASTHAVLRTLALALALATTTALTACSSFTPVYGDHGTSIERTAFRYDKPATRLDQLIYQELALKLGRSTDPSLPLVRVTTSTSSRKLTRSDVTRPSEQREAVVTAKVELVGPGGQVATTFTRSASALYTTDSQALAATEAQRDAEERAARELAETVRLSLIGALANPL